MDLINIGLYLTYLLIGAALLLTLVFTLKEVFSDAASMKSALIGLGFLGGVLLISWLLGSADQGAFYERYNISPAKSKLISGGLIATYILGALAIIAMIWASVSNFVKR